MSFETISIIWKKTLSSGCTMTQILFINLFAKTMLETWLPTQFFEQPIKRKYGDVILFILWCLRRMNPLFHNHFSVFVAGDIKQQHGNDIFIVFQRLINFAGIRLYLNFDKL